MMHAFDPSVRPFTVRVTPALTPADLRDLVGEAMQIAGLLERPAPPAALRWIETFLEAYRGRLTAVADAPSLVAGLRAESVIVPALQL